MLFNDLRLCYRSEPQFIQITFMIFFHINLYSSIFLHYLILGSYICSNNQKFFGIIWAIE